MPLKSNKRILPLLLLISVLSSFRAQDSLRRYPFVHYERNRLTFPGDSSIMKDLYHKMNRINNGHHDVVKVVHIGGSHVQAGIWSNAFITTLQKQKNTNGGGYFVFPYRLGKTNGPAFARSFSTGKWKLCRSLGKQYCEPLGPSAVTVLTHDSIATFGVRLTDAAACQKPNVIKVYHEFSKGYNLRMITRGDQPKRSDKSEEGFSEFTLDEPSDSLVFEIVKTNDTAVFRLFGFSLETRKNSGYYLAALGANGASSASFLKSQTLLPFLREMKPDLVILSLGVNDTQGKNFSKEKFIRNYDSLIKIVRLANPECAILLTTTTDNYIKGRSNKRTIPAWEATMTIMEKNKVAVWDLYNIMGGYKSMVKWVKGGMAARDKIHFNQRGYQLLGAMMAQAIIRSYESQSKK